MSRFFSLVYGIVCYIMFLAVLLYAVAWVGNMWVPDTIDAGTPEPLVPSLLINLALLSLFAVQHSVMARPAFKRWWTKIIPKHVERSTFVLVTNLVLILLFWQWRPMPEIVWTTTSDLVATILIVLFWIGWGMVLVSTFLIDHFSLFGLRQVLAHYKRVELPPARFIVRGLYRVVRHPLILGFIIAFWATPDMSQGHLLFAAVTTVYMLVAIQIEEKDLITEHGERYLDYRGSVSMILPLRYTADDLSEPLEPLVDSETTPDVE